MIDALRYEVVRMRTIRSTYWLIGIAIVLHLIVTILITWALPPSGPLNGGDRAFEILATMGGSAGFPLVLAYIVGLLGVFAMGHEYRHGMIRATLTALPNRVSVLAAKVVVIAVISALTVLVCVLLSLLVMLPFDVRMPAFDAVRDVTVGTMLYVILFAVAGLALAAIIRNQTAAVALTLLLPTVVEQLIKGVVVLIRVLSDDPVDKGGLAGILKFLPYDAGAQMYTQFSVDDVLEPFGVTSFGPVGGGLVMATFVAILLALSTWLFLRRDA